MDKQFSIEWITRRGLFADSIADKMNSWLQNNPYIEIINVKTDAFNDKIYGNIIYKYSDKKNTYGIIEFYSKMLFWQTSVSDQINQWIREHSNLKIVNVITFISHNEVLGDCVYGHIIYEK